MKRVINVGTRQSKLALAQTNWVIDKLKTRHPDLEFNVIKISTKGDMLAHIPLDKIGGKGVFVKDIERALINGDIDMAVHSMKDVPASIPDGLIIAAIPEREDARDVLISENGRTLEQLPVGSVIGTGSLRRGLQVRGIRDDISVKQIRGNVDTRLRKLHEGEYDAVILAAAGLNRLGLKESAQYLSVDVCIPAVGQGALGVEIRKDDKLGDVLKSIDHFETRIAVDCERAFLSELNGNCKIPVAAHAEIIGDNVVIKGMLVFKKEWNKGLGITERNEYMNKGIFYENDFDMVRGQKSGILKEHMELGKNLAKELLEKAGLTLDDWLKMSKNE